MSGYRTGSSMGFDRERGPAPVEQPTRVEPRPTQPSGGVPSGGSGSPDPHSAPQIPSWRPPSWEDFRRMQPAPNSGWGGQGQPWWAGMSPWGGYGSGMHGGRGDYRSNPDYRRAFNEWWDNSALKRHSGYGDGTTPSWAHDVFAARMGWSRGGMNGYNGNMWYGAHGMPPGGPMPPWMRYGMMHGMRDWGGYGGGYDRYRSDREHGKRRRHGHSGREWRGRDSEQGWGPRNDNYQSPWAFWRRMMWGY